MPKKTARTGSGNPEAGRPGPSLAGRADPVGKLADLLRAGPRGLTAYWEAGRLVLSLAPGDGAAGRGRIPRLAEELGARGVTITAGTLYRLRKFAASFDQTRVEELATTGVTFEVVRPTLPLDARARERVLRRAVGAGRVRSAREVLALVDREARYRAARRGRVQAARSGKPPADPAAALRALRAVCRRWEFVIKGWAGDPAAGSKRARALARADGGDAFLADLAEAAADAGRMADEAASLARRLADLSAVLRAGADAGPD